MSANDIVTDRAISDTLFVDLGAFDGPLDVLLSLSHRQKVDLRQVSILSLAKQYLMFVDQAKELRIELAADYLVMAAWLAFLKSRLLLPADPKDEGPSGAELAANLAFQLERLQAMRKSATRLMALDQLGRNRFARGKAEKVTLRKKVTYTANILDLMQAYARIKTKDEFRPFVFDRDAILSMEQALDRLRSLIGFSGEWNSLESYLPAAWSQNPKKRRSAIAATFAASLELVKEGHMDIKQEDVFSPIKIRKRDNSL